MNESAFLSWIKGLMKTVPIKQATQIAIISYLNQNKVNDRQVNDTKYLSHFLQNANLPINNKFHFNGHISLKYLEALFEQNIDVDLQRSQGAFYTPNYIIDYLIAEGQGVLNQGKGLFCDPACGSGGFLLRAINFYLNTFSISIPDIVESRIFGFDNDPKAIEFSNIILDLFLLEKGFSPQNLKRNIYELDSLLTDPVMIKEKLKINEGFDLICTNPPYVKLQNMERDYRLELLKKYPNFAKGSYSLSILFILAAYNLINEKGKFSFITQNNLFTSLAAITIREFCQQHKAIEKIIDFAHYKVFQKASAYTCLIFFDRQEKEHILYSQVTEQPNVKVLATQVFSEIPYKSLNSKKWRLGNNDRLSNIHRIETTGEKLGSLFNIKVGFATLKDEVFFVYKHPDNFYYGSSNDGDIRIESDIIKPAIRIADFNSEGELLNNNRGIIFPYEKKNGKYLPIIEEKMIKLFPESYRYLKMHQQSLLQRSKGELNSTIWYEWGRIQSMEAPGPKLLTKTFSKKPNFFLDITDSLFCNGYAIFPRSSDVLFEKNINLHILQKILNSNIMLYYLKGTSFQIEGDYQCYQKNFIEKFSIPNFTYDELSKLENGNSRQIEQILISKYKLNPDYDQFIKSINWFAA